MTMIDANKPPLNCCQASQPYPTKTISKYINHGLAVKWAKIALVVGLFMGASVHVLAIGQLNNGSRTPDSIDLLNAPVTAPISLPTTGENGLVKFSSLSPLVLAYLSQQAIAPDGALMPNMRQLRIVDSQGNAMPMALRLVKNVEQVSQPLPIVSVNNDNPAAVEKLRQAVLVAVDNASGENSISLELKSFPRNPTLATDAPTGQEPVTWWLANPLMEKTSHHNTLDNASVAQIDLNFTKPKTSRPLQIQLYGSNDLQSWEMLNQGVVSPFNAEKSKGIAQISPETRRNVHQIHQNFELTSTQGRYRYWQVIANQPVALTDADIRTAREQSRYFLTRANFTRNADANGGKNWQLDLPQPMFSTGMRFFVPQNQLWQVSLNATSDDRTKLAQLMRQPLSPNATTKPLLSTTQIEPQHDTITWQPTIVQHVNLSGQLPADNLPVTLLTPVYELLFLAQGEAPYQLRINDSASLSKPPIVLSGNQIAQLPLLGEGQLGMLLTSEDADVRNQRYKQWLLWGVLGLIVVVLLAMAYRLYQQTTTQRPIQ